METDPLENVEHLRHPTSQEYKKELSYEKSDWLQSFLGQLFKIFYLRPEEQVSYLRLAPLAAT